MKFLSVLSLIVTVSSLSIERLRLNKNRFFNSRHSEELYVATGTEAPPQDCVGGYGPFSDCSASCGGGTQSRTYSVSTTAANGGADCSSSDGDVDTETCNNQPCPEDCVGAFDDWTDCSASCGGGTQSRTYSIISPADFGGNDCEYADNYVDSQSCNTNDCPVSCVGSWGKFSSCSASCGGGVSSSSYSVSVPAANGGKDCPANDGDVKSKPCNTQACKVNCVGHWSPFSACDAKCGGGSQSKTYSVVTPASNGGKNCPANDGDVSTKACNTQVCKVNCVGSWSPYSACSASCGGGVATRTYSVITEAVGGGKNCPANDGDVATRACNTKACPKPKKHF